VRHLGLVRHNLLAHVAHVKGQPHHVVVRAPAATLRPALAHLFLLRLHHFRSHRHERPRRVRQKGRAAAQELGGDIAAPSPSFGWSVGPGSERWQVLLWRAAALLLAIVAQVVACFWEEGELSSPLSLVWKESAAPICPVRL
jgi:hypothetical protein